MKMQPILLSCIPRQAQGGIILVIIMVVVLGLLLGEDFDRVFRLVMQ